MEPFHWATLHAPKAPNKLEMFALLCLAILIVCFSQVAAVNTFDLTDLPSTWQHAPYISSTTILYRDSLAHVSGS